MGLLPILLSRVFRVRLNAESMMTVKAATGFPRELPYALVGLAIQDSLAPTGYSAFIFPLLCLLSDSIVYIRKVCVRN